MLNTCRVLWIEILNLLLCGLPVGLAIAYWSEVKLNRFTKMSYSTSKHSLWSRLEHLNISVIWSERVFFYSLNTVDSLSGICWVIVVGGSLWSPLYLTVGCSIHTMNRRPWWLKCTVYTYSTTAEVWGQNLIYWWPKSGARISQNLTSPCYSLGTESHSPVAGSHPG